MAAAIYAYYRRAKLAKAQLSKVSSATKSVKPPAGAGFASKKKNVNKARQHFTANPPRITRKGQPGFAPDASSNTSQSSYHSSSDSDSEGEGFGCKKGHHDTKYHAIQML